MEKLIGNTQAITFENKTYVLTIVVNKINIREHKKEYTWKYLLTVEGNEKQEGTVITNCGLIPYSKVYKQMPWGKDKKIESEVIAEMFL